MDPENIVGKRKRQLKECPNPLFVHWLREWTEDAAAKGMKSQYTYRKVGSLNITHEFTRY